MKLLTLLFSLKSMMDANHLISDKYKSSSIKFRDEDTEFHRVIKNLIPEELAHTGSTMFDEHLRGVQAILRYWNSDTAISNAGLFHSIYGTEGFQGHKLPLKNRDFIRSLIGKRAERLVWIFCVVDRLSVDQTVHEYIQTGQYNKTTFYSRIEYGRFPIILENEEEWLDFIELTLADWLEQVEGAAMKENPLFGFKVGEAWSYRRTAYAEMAQILLKTRSPRLEVAYRMHREIYDSEPLETRHLIQIITPPMSEAAREAREAMASINY